MQRKEVNGQFLHRLYQEVTGNVREPWGSLPPTFQAVYDGIAPPPEVRQFEDLVMRLVNHQLEGNRDE